MHRICILFVCLFFYLSDYITIFSSDCEENISIHPTIHLSFNFFKQIHLPKGCSLNIVFFSKNSRKFATSPSPALDCYWLFKKLTANRSDCKLALLRWEHAVSRAFSMPMAKWWLKQIWMLITTADYARIILGTVIQFINIHHIFLLSCSLKHLCDWEWIYLE